VAERRPLWEFAWIMVVLTACGAAALGIAKAFGIPDEHVPGVGFWLVVLCLGAYLLWTKKLRRKK